MFWKGAALALGTIAFVHFGAASLYAQSSTGAGAPSVGAAAGKGMAAESRELSGSATISDQDRDSGKHSKAKGGRDRTGKNDSLPKPIVKDDPLHRCLAPAGVC